MTLYSPPAGTAPPERGALAQLLAAAKVAEHHWCFDPEGDQTAREYAKAYDNLQQAILAAETLLAAPKEDQ